MNNAREEKLIAITAFYCFQECNTYKLLKKYAGIKIEC